MAMTYGARILKLLDKEYCSRLEMSLGNEIIGARDCGKCGRTVKWNVRKWTQRKVFGQGDSISTVLTELGG
jgi:hypothetical protein